MVSMPCGFAEHHFSGYGGAIPSVPVLAAAAAQRTQRIQIGSGVALIVLNDPVRVAEEFAMLDNRCGGRLDFGIGRASQRLEYDAFSVPMDESRARFNEAHEIILKAWSDEPVTVAGKFRSLNEVNITPKPAQRPHPPIYVACIMTPDSFEFTGTYGYNLMYVPYVGSPEDGVARIKTYREWLAKSGYEPASREVMMCVHAFCGESAEHARDCPRPFVRNYFQFATWANRVDADQSQYKGYGGIGKIFQHIRENSDFMYPNQVIFGNSEQCLERIAYYEAMGATHISLINNFGGMPHAEIMRSLERVVKHVLPHLKREPQRATAGQ